ncbi:MAG: D-alanyl-D-alanine carboxypeptidase family protein [Actinomycetes bacterium]
MSGGGRIAAVTAVVAVAAGGIAAASGVITGDSGAPQAPVAAASPTTSPKPVAYTAPKVDWGVTRAPAKHRIRPNLKGRPAAGILIDASTGEVMWALRPDSRRSIASLTKMMNALVALDRAKPDRKVLISRYAGTMGGSTVGGLPIGERVRVGTLLRGMMIVSGNDAANALAEGLGPGRSRFVARMNARARAMHLPCTRFTSPEGLGTGNRSCARDLAVIGRAVLADRDLARIVAREWDGIAVGRNGKRLLHNRNPLVQRHYPGITGIKTGYTAAAGYCLVASAKRGNRKLIAVLLGEDEQARMMQRLLDSGFRALRRQAD